MQNQSTQNWAVRIFWACAGLCLILSSIRQLVMSFDAEPSAYTLVITLFFSGLIYICAVYAALRRSEMLDPKYVIVVGIICRLILLPSTPLFYDGMNRNLWDGKVTASGINPYIYAPDSDKLIALRDINWALMTDCISRSTNPPLAQILLAGFHLAGVRSAAALKCVLFVFDVMNMLLILSLLKALRLPRCWVLVYAWSPIAIKEFSNSGHLEPVMLFFLLFALYFWLSSSRRLHWAGALYGGAISIGFISVILAPVAWRLGRWKSVICGAVVAAMFYLPFINAGKYLITEVGAYARFWTFNDGAYALLRTVQEYVYPNAWTLPVSPARVITALTIGFYSVYAAKKLNDGDRIAAVATIRNVFAVCLLVMPVVNPWYVCWLLPFMCISMSVGLLLFTITCSLSYLNYAYGTLPVWILLIEYVPVYIVLLGEHYIGRKFAPPTRIPHMAKRSDT